MQGFGGPAMERLPFFSAMPTLRRRHDSECAGPRVRYCFERPVGNWRLGFADPLVKNRPSLDELPE
jgi:hypothetical protein